MRDVGYSLVYRLVLCVCVDSVPRRLGVRIRILVKAYAVLGSGLCVCRIAEWEYVCCVDGELVHGFKDINLRELELKDKNLGK